VLRRDGVVAMGPFDLIMVLNFKLNHVDEPGEKVSPVLIDRCTECLKTQKI
jgi:hypothetical protein